MSNGRSWHTYKGKPGEVGDKIKVDRDVAIAGSIPILGKIIF